MRFLRSFLSLALVSTAFASPPSKDTRPPEEEKQATVFNGKDVPPMLQLSTENIDDKIAKGNWCVSPSQHVAAHQLTLSPGW